MYISPGSLKNSPTDLQPGEWQLFCECGFKFEKGTAARPICPDCGRQMYIAQGETMDQPYIDALVNQALGAYKAGGDEGLEHWKKGLPALHLAEFERDCAEPLKKAIEALGSVEPYEDPDPTKWPADKDATQPSDPRRKHTRDRRRTKPL